MTATQTTTSPLTPAFSFQSWQKYLVVCFLIYLGGFYIAPDGGVQQRWFYYTVTLIASFMLIFKGRTILSDPRADGLKFVMALTFLLAIPFLWNREPYYLVTVRNGIERWFFVFSFCLAVFYCWKRPQILTRTAPRIILICAGIALALLYYKAISLGQYQFLKGYGPLSTHANQTGMPMGAAATLAMSQALLSTQRRWRFAWLVYAGLLASATVLSTSRSAMLGFAFASAAVYYLHSGKRWIFVVPLIFGLIGLAYILLYYPDPIHKALSGREHIWSHIWHGFQNNPFFGVGATTTNEVISHRGHKLEAHSMYFAVAYYAGIYGLIVAGLLLLRIFRNISIAPEAVRHTYIPLLAYGLAVQTFEGVYLIYVPHPFWLFTWLPFSVFLLYSQRTAERLPAGTTETSH